MRNFLSMIAVLGVMSAAATVNAADWGDLKIKFTYDGTPPKAAPIQVTKDPQFCGKHNLKTEKLVVNPANKGIKNIVVYIYTRGSTKVPVHPSYEEAANKSTLNNMNCRYEPHVVAVRVGQKLEIGNPDPIAHNSKIDFFSNAPQNPIIPPTKSVLIDVKQEERLPARVSCSIHPWMEAWVVAKKHPYVGVSNEDGEVVIKNIPAGKWTFQFWQEQSGYLQEVQVDGKKTSWRRGRADLTITSKGLDLGEVKVPAAAFKK